MAYIIYLHLSILKFARLVQINWLEVRHPIFNWWEFRLLISNWIRMNSKYLQTGSLSVNFTQRAFWMIHETVCRRSGQFFKYQDYLYRGCTLKNRRHGDLERTVRMLNLNRQAVTKLNLGISNSPLCLNPITDQVTFFNHIAGFNLVTLSDICL